MDKEELRKHDKLKLKVNVYEVLAKYAYGQDYCFKDKTRDIVEEVLAIPEIAEAILLKKQIEERLSNMKIVERCPDCSRQVLVSLTYCETCKDTGVIKKPASLEDVLQAMETPTDIFRGRK